MFLDNPGDFSGLALGLFAPELKILIVSLIDVGWFFVKGVLYFFAQENYKKTKQPNKLFYFLFYLSAIEALIFSIKIIPGLLNGTIWQAVFVFSLLFFLPNCFFLAKTASVIFGSPKITRLIFISMLVLYFFPLGLHVFHDYQANESRKIQNDFFNSIVAKARKDLDPAVCDQMSGKLSAEEVSQCKDIVQRDILNSVKK